MWTKKNKDNDNDYNAVDVETISDELDILYLRCNKCNVNEYFITILSTQGEIANITSGLFFSSSVMHTYVALLNHHVMHYSQDKILLPEFWRDTKTHDVSFFGMDRLLIKTVVVIVSDGLNHHGVLCVHHDGSGIIYDGLVSTNHDLYRSCFKHVMSALKGEDIPLNQVVVSKTKLARLAKANVDPNYKHTIVHSDRFVQPYGSNACGPLACIVARELVDQKYQLPINPYASCRGLVIEETRHLLWEHREDIFAGLPSDKLGKVQYVKVMESDQKENFLHYVRNN